MCKRITKIKKMFNIKSVISLNKIKLKRYKYIRINVKLYKTKHKIYNVNILKRSYFIRNLEHYY